MKTLQLNKKNEIRLLKGSCDMHPIEILNPEKKPLTGYDWATLRYIAADYLLKNGEQLGLNEILGEDDARLLGLIDEESTIQDNCLYVGNFEGYQVGWAEFDQTIIHAFAFDTSGRIMALIETGVTSEREGVLKWYLID